MLLQPSQAESLIDLQAEFNALKISEKQTGYDEDEEMLDSIKVSHEWNLSHYYT